MLGHPVLSPDWDPVEWGLLNHQHLSADTLPPPPPPSQVKPVKTVNNQNKTVIQPDLIPPSLSLIF